MNPSDLRGAACLANKPRREALCNVESNQKRQGLEDKLLCAGMGCVGLARGGDVVGMGLVSGGVGRGLRLLRPAHVRGVRLCQGRCA